ncbi:hypothetical protein M378DRAFT_168271, partial [Amanita muscaria Koide BX008]
MQAVEHVLEQWTTGRLIKSSNQFSTKNYDDQEEQKPSMDPVTKRKIITKVMTYGTAFFIDNIEVVKERHWKPILEDARGHIKKNKWKETVDATSKSNNSIIVEAESNKRQRKIVVDDS